MKTFWLVLSIVACALLCALGSSQQPDDPSAEEPIALESQTF